MNHPNIEELTGRIQGLADFVLRLTAALEMNGTLDGPHFTGAIHTLACSRQTSVRMPHSADALIATRDTLQYLADQLDRARELRGQ